MIGQGHLIVAVICGPRVARCTVILRPVVGAEYGIVASRTSAAAEPVRRGTAHFIGISSHCNVLHRLVPGLAAFDLHGTGRRRLAV